MPKKKSVNKPFLWTVLALVFFGFTVFYSASTGLAAREGLAFYGIIMNQLFIGVLGGLFMMFIFSKVDHNIIKKYGLLFFIIALITNFLMFIPSLGITNGGATRWIGIGGFSLQPSEFLKVTSIILIASWFNFHKKDLKKPWFALISIISTIFMITIPLILQKDFDIIFLIALPLIAMFFVSKAPLKTGLILGGITLLVATILIFTIPHVKTRVFGFFNPNEGGQTVNYQYRQSQIAIGSGGIFGKGFGQSTQKFGSLPEPTNVAVFGTSSLCVNFFKTTAPAVSVRNSNSSRYSFACFSSCEPVINPTSTAFSVIGAVSIIFPFY